MKSSTKTTLLKADGSEQEIDACTPGLAPVAFGASVKSQQTAEEAFPDIDPGVKPLGNRILVQIRSPRVVTKGGIYLSSESQDHQKWNEMTAKVVALGPLAFKNRDTMEPWPEGDWCTPGQFVRVPKYGGDRWERTINDVNALFVIFNDHEIISMVICNPLELETTY